MGAVRLRRAHGEVEDRDAVAAKKLLDGGVREIREVEARAVAHGLAGRLPLERRHAAAAGDGSSTQRSPRPAAMIVLTSSFVVT